MKFEILIRILFELMSKKSVSAIYLADKYEVSTRTIYRYINCIECAGIPIYTTRGKYGGFSIVDSYKFSSTFMTVSEYNQTIDALSAIVKSVPNKTLSSAINKLKAGSRNEFNSFDIKSGNLIIDAGPWGDTVGYKAKLALLQRAIDEKSVLTIKYHDRTGSVSERNIEPHVIVFKQGLWYVYAYCRLRNEFRFFKTGRIEQANFTGEKFSRREINNDELPLNFWHANIIAEDVIMEIDKSVLSDVEEWLGIENVKEINGKHVAEVSLPYDEGLVSKIMSYGKGVKVISPQKLKDKIKENVSELIEIYQ
ncbi:MAG: YafY family transcriptional regulator [Clostridia bacterium]|nr:YafY family transcriptional regulator [Clostridia bacterium]